MGADDLIIRVPRSRVLFLDDDVHAVGERMLANVARVEDRSRRRRQREQQGERDSDCDDSSSLVQVALPPGASSWLSVGAATSARA